MSAFLKSIIAENEQFQRRLPSLYSDFSLQREINPDGFSANLSAWQEALTKAVRAGLASSNNRSPDVLSLRTGEELLQLLETKNGARPLALGAVIDELVRQHRMIPLVNFLASSAIIGGKNRGIGPLRLISWGLHQLGILHETSASGNMRDERLVILSNVEEVAQMVIKQLFHPETYVDQVFSVDVFRAEAANAVNLTTEISTTDLKIILTYLAREKGVITYDDEVVKFIKFQSGPPIITAEDRAIVSLKTLIAKLNAQVGILASRIDELMNEAQGHVKNQNRSSSLHALRLRKLAETSLEQKMQTLSQLESIYSKIEEAKDQVAMVHAMKASTEVLRGLHAQTGGADKIEDVVEELQNEMIKVDQISSVFDEAGKSDNIVDEEALDEELQLLINAEQARKDENRSEKIQGSLARNNSSKDIDVAGTTKPVSSSVDQKAPNGSEENEDLLVKEGTEAIAQMSLG